MKTSIALVFTFCIIISSCAVKNSIKQLLNVDRTSNSQSSIPNRNYHSVASSLKCKFCKEKETLSQDHGLKDLMPSDAEELVFTFVAFCGLFTFKKEFSHPLYNTSKIGKTISIFLQYRKLII
ncbi:hypothetical protein [Chryseobacterium sp. c4a]|uniref:hypothetical protein n=1 Tax=Chryseobacterium sp. c4a TaxID=1573582 RepID=UPI001357EE9C|nr:hypothetical protein [Chryseobacterium sp. c4a]